MDLQGIGSSMSTFNYQSFARTLGTQAISYTVAGIPLATYGCVGVSAGLLGVMFLYEGGDKQEGDEQKGDKPDTPPEPSPESQTGGKKKRKTRRKHTKRKK